MRIQTAKAWADLTGGLRTAAPRADSVRCGGPVAPPAGPGGAAARSLHPQAPADATAGPRRPQAPADRSLARL